MNWDELTLGEVMDVKHGYAFDGEFFADEGDHILLTPGNCNETGGLKLKGEKEKYYTGEVPPQYLLSAGDMLVVMTDLVNTAPILGGSFLIPEDNKYLHNQRLGLVQVSDEGRIDRTFLYYLLNSHEYRAQVRGSASGATVRHTSPSRIRACKLRVPRDVAYQRKIGEMLAAYDDLIENNRRRTALLEEAARLLYREWFVRLRFPGHERVRVTKGAPEGWSQKPLSDVAESCLGKMLDEKKNKGRPLAYLANVNVRWGEFDLENLREMRFEDHEIERFSIRPGDIVMCEGGEPGRCAVWRGDAPIMFQKALHRIRARGNSDQRFLYYELSRQAREGRFGPLLTGGTIKHLPREKLAQVEVTVPPLQMQHRFSEAVSAYDDAIANYRRQNQRLRAARDLLLPRLLSGEIEV